MPRRRAELLLAVLLALGTLAVLLSIFSAGYFPVQSDETDVAWVAKQVSMGRVPYGDFFSFIPPLTLYGLGAFFKLVGPSLAALRLLSVAWLVLVVLALYVLLLRSRVPPPWAAAASFVVPAVFLPYWPVPSHHWFALGLGLASLLVLAREEPARVHWFAAGLLTAASALSLQTEGALFACLLLLRWIMSPREARRSAAVAAAAGGAIPAALFALVLLLSGSLGWAYYDLVRWPAQFYKQPGGFNDVKPLAFLSTFWASQLQGTGGLAGMAPVVALTAAYLLPLLALLLPALEPGWTEGARKVPRRWLFSVAGTLLVAFVYLSGRADWTHLVFWSPLLLLFLAQGLDWERERLRPAVLKSWLAVCVILACLRWVPFWAGHPPLVSDILKVDGQVAAQGTPAVLSLLPDVVRDRRPVLSFGMQGSALYFFWAPVPPPVDWLMPPSARYNAPWEYEVVARFAREHRVPYILVPASQLSDFRDLPSPVSDLLREDYRVLRETPWGVLMQRVPDAPSSR